MSKDQTTQPTLFQEDSPVNHSALQENEKEKMMTATSGMKLLELLPKQNQNGLLEKMLKELLTSPMVQSCNRYNKTWKKRVSKSNVLLFQLQVSVLGIKEKESGLSDAMFQTPTTQDARIGPNNIGGNKHRMKRGSIALADQILFQTPTATEIPMRSKEAMEKRKKYRESIGRKTVPPGNLLEQIQMMYPTPTQDSASERTKKYNQGGLPLPLAVKMYPTPTAGCEEGGEQSDRVEQTKSGGFVLRKKNKPDMTFGAKLSDAMLYLEKKILPNTNSKGLQGCSLPTELEREQRQVITKRDTEKQQTWWEIESSLCGVPNGISYELDKGRSNRIKALGNSIVPLIAYEIGKAIISAEDQSD
jgi:site-specific DNA-cytosine methylase